uniref:Uncharacterized protein n=1 Tax=Anguilla anguilla TaxID=7936 RepID=A0A0E9XQV7_ANGAN
MIAYSLVFSLEGVNLSLHRFLGLPQISNSFLHYFFTKYVQFLFFNTLLSVRDKETLAPLCPSTSSYLDHLYHIANVLVHQHKIALRNVNAFIRHRGGDQYLTLI